MVIVKPTKKFRFEILTEDECEECETSGLSRILINFPLKFKT